MRERQASAPPPARRKRASKAQVRVFAWTASALSFLGALVSLTLSPKPAQGAPLPTSQKPTQTRPVVIVITKKIVYAATAQPVASSTGPVHYVYTPAAAPAVAVSCGTSPC